MTRYLGIGNSRINEIQREPSDVLLTLRVMSKLLCGNVYGAICGVYSTAALYLSEERESYIQLLN